MSYALLSDKGTMGRSSRHRRWGRQELLPIVITLILLTIYNVRLYIGSIQERHGLIGGSRLVGLHYRLGGPESAQCALESRAAPFARVPSSRPGDPMWNIGDWR